MVLLGTIEIGGCARHKYKKSPKPCDCPEFKNNPRVKKRSYYTPDYKPFDIINSKISQPNKA